MNPEDKAREAWAKFQASGALFKANKECFLAAFLAGYAERGRWLPIEDYRHDVERPFGSQIVIWSREGIELAEYSEGEPDGVDSMGHDAGWIGIYAFPGRSFGNPKYFSEPQGQPTRFMVIEPPPMDGEAEDPAPPPAEKE
jgi:hypothetical protein